MTYILPRSQLISFPRSGSTVLTNILTVNFNLPFIGFDEVTNNGKAKFARSHNVKLKIHDKVKYIVMYRHPVQSISSFYWKTHKKFDKIQWEDFVEGWVNRWLAFTKYWIIKSKLLSNIFYIYYDSLVRNTTVLFSSLSHFLLDTKINWVGTEQIESRHRLSTKLNNKFNEKILDNLEKRCSFRLEELGLKNWRESE